ncbi:hypothetical protein [Salinibacter altiplanensis]|uniref:hypothetical protein n=1 Tax=Salinibacter altiplanensis TaxID=1803181 RepID=UPI000C9FAC3A|nr:hypothetical protein [Salinibacter altiplanensis]
MADQDDRKQGRTEVDLADSRYSDGKVTPDTRIGVDEEGIFLYEKEGSSFTRTGERPDKRRSPDERPEDGIEVGFDGPADLTSYHETNWLDRVAVSQYMVEVTERHYPPIKKHLPLRLLLQYLLFNRHVVKYNTTWDGEGSPLPGTMLSWIAGRLDQYRSNNFRAEDMLWWAKDELFDGAFAWTDWKPHPHPRKRRPRRLKDVSIAPDVKDAAEWELKHPIEQAPSRVWFDNGNVCTRQSVSDCRNALSQSAQTYGAEVFGQKGNPEVPRAIQTYLNNLPVDGFNKVIRDHSEEAYAATQRLSDESPDGDRDLGVRHARATLQAVETCPKPFYEPKLRTPRLFAPRSLQLLNREVRATLVQDWIPLDLKSAQFAICARKWGVGPLLDFLEGGGDIWDELTSWMDLPKPALKKALYAITFGARAQWTAGRPPSTLNNALADEAGLSPENADQARDKLMNHPLMKKLRQARNRRIEEIKSKGQIEDCFGSVMTLPSQESGDGSRENTVLTLLAAESSAIEMQLLWPAFQEVIGQEKRCKIMLYTFDGIYIKPADPSREDTWVEKLQEAVNEEANRLRMPTTLELET